MAPAAAAPGGAARAKPPPRAALNPSFSWEGGADAAAPLPQAPWDFKSACAAARLHAPRGARASSLHVPLRTRPAAGALTACASSLRACVCCAAPRVRSPRRCC
jgi:hypothetical protein